MVSLSAIESHAGAEIGLTLSDWNWFAADAQNSRCSARHSGVDSSQ